jgi:hypothetical protein
MSPLGRGMHSYNRRRRIILHGTQDVGVTVSIDQEEELQVQPDVVSFKLPDEQGIHTNATINAHLETDLFVPQAINRKNHLVSRKQEFKTPVEAGQSVLVKKTSPVAKKINNKIELETRGLLLTDLREMLAGTQPIRWFLLVMM